MQQQTSEWTRWRHAGIGSSDAPIIMGVSPWKTPLQLYYEKINKPVEHASNFIQEKGNRLEPIIRTRAELLLECDLKPEVFEHKDYPFMRASMDGYNARGSVGVELKFVGENDFKLVQSGACIDKYYPQIQHQYMVSGLASIYLIAYYIPKGHKESDGYVASLRIPVNMEYIKRLAKAEMDFWNCVQQKEPPAMSDKDYPVIKEKEAVELAKKFAKAKTKLDAAEADVETLRDEILALSSDNFKVGHVVVTAQERKGSVDYAKIPELLNVDLEPYRKASSVSRVVRVQK